MRKSWVVVGCAAIVAALTPQADAFEIDFEGLPAGLVISELTPGAGLSNDALGVVKVDGFNPDFGLSVNPVIVFDTSNITGGDYDLGTPNENFGGPGVGAAGESGPTANTEAFGKIAIIAEDLVDNNGDDLIDDPDDTVTKGTFVEYDFSKAGKGNGSNKTVTINRLWFIDIEEELGEGGTFVELSGPSLPVNLVALPPTGNNGVASIGPLNLSGVQLMRVNFNGTGAMMHVTYDEEELEPSDCWFTFGGFHNAGIQSGGKDFTFGGNVGPPPAGSINVVDHNTGDHFHSTTVMITDCFVVQSTGPGQPGGKKGFEINAATFAGTGRINNVDGFEFTGMVIDAGEPAGKKNNDKDFFEVVVTDPNDGDAIVFLASGYLDGGNMQLHPPVGK